MVLSPAIRIVENEEAEPNMPITAMATNWLVSWKDYSQTGTIDVWPPIWTHGFIALSKVGGDGVASAGFLWCRYRDQDDKELQVALGKKGTESASTEFCHDKVTKVAFEVWTFEEMGYATVVLTFWS